MFLLFEEHVNNRAQHIDHMRSSLDKKAAEHLGRQCGYCVMHRLGMQGCSAHKLYIAQVETGFVDGKTEIRGCDTTSIVRDSLLRIRWCEFQDHRGLRIDQCPRVIL